MVSYAILQIFKNFNVNFFMSEVNYIESDSQFLIELFKRLAKKIC